jgi:hypothetical protein
MSLKDLGILTNSDYSHEKKIAQKYLGSILAMESIYNVEAVAFYAYLENFSDQITSEWNTQQVYGRIDPIYNFGGNRRQINISWLVPARSIVQAKENLRKINKLTSFLYPIYDQGALSHTLRSSGIQQAPIVAVKFGNLISRSDGGAARGFLNGLTFTPDNEMGYFMSPSEASAYPKLIQLQTQFTVIHDEAAFWNMQEFQAGENWPRRVTKVGSEGVSENSYNDHLTNYTPEQQVGAAMNIHDELNPQDSADPPTPVEEEEETPPAEENSSDDEEITKDYSDSGTIFL